MPQSEEKTPRITAGPIEDLGLIVDKLIKKGFVYPQDEPNRIKLVICTQFGVEEIRSGRADNPLDEVLGYVFDYLSRNNMYLARANMRSESSMVITGDLYKEKLDS